MSDNLAPPQEPQCSQCKKICTLKEEKNKLFGYPCDCCGSIVCKTCSHLSASEVRVIPMTSRVLLFLCQCCIEKIKQIPKTTEKVAELRSQVDVNRQESESKLCQFEERLSKLEQRTVEMAEHMNKNLKQSTYAEVVALKGRVDKFESQVNTVPSVAAGTSVEPAISEIQEREKRACNVLIFGIEERTEKSREERLSKEIESVRNLLSQSTIDVSPDGVRVHRLGAYSAEKRRPIRVEFPERGLALRVLKCKSKLDSNGVYIKSDKTNAQRKYLKQIVEELNERKTKGEENLRIKYINNVPKIIKTSLVGNGKNSTAARSRQNP